MSDGRPILVGGLDRSGKTYMRLALSAHPNIAPIQRTNWWYSFYKQYGDLERRENFERCLAALLQYKHVALLQPDPARLRQEFAQGAPTYARLFALIHEHYAQRQGKPRWGVQTELIERYATHIFAAYPTAKLIHMLRDPRDRYEAVLTRGVRSKGGTGRAIAQWLLSARLAQHNQRTQPERYLVVRYESLVQHPEATLRQVCAFLEESYSAAMLALNNAPRFKNAPTEGEDFGVQRGTPLSSAFIGRYRAAIPPHELAFMQQHAGREMATFGYPPTPVRLSPGAALRYAFLDWPLNVARMVSWQSMNEIRYNLLPRIRRTPIFRSSLSVNS